MNITETQAAGLSKMFPLSPTIERDAKVFATKTLSLIAEQLGDQPLPDLRVIQGMLNQAHCKAIAQSREEDVTDALAVVAGASLIECKRFVDALVERVSSLVGVAIELEDAAFVLENEIAAEESC